MPELKPTRRRTALVLLIAAICGAAGCKDREVTSYRIPKETQAAAAPEAPSQGQPAARGAGATPNTNDLPASKGSDMGGMPVRTAETPSLRWRAPGDWRTKAGSSMRKGSYSAGGAEVAITAFPGDVGGVLANVNRWRNQVGLAPVAESELDRVTVPIDANGLHFIVTDAEGSSARIVTALLPWQGATWFFKLTGPSDAVGRAKPAFIEFVKTVQSP